MLSVPSPEPGPRRQRWVRLPRKASAVQWKRGSGNRLRGRGRAVDETAGCQDLGPGGPDPGGPCPWPGSGRVSMAGMTCFRRGERSRLFYSFHVYRGRKGEKKGFTWEDHRDLVVRAHIRLGGPIVLIWDNLRAHLMPPMRAFIEANEDWLTVFQLPSYAPDLNPREGIWSLVGRTVGNLAANLDQLARAVRRSLKQIRYRPRLADKCLAGTGMIMDS